MNSTIPREIGSAPVSCSTRWFAFCLRMVSVVFLLHLVTPAMAQEASDAQAPEKGFSRAKTGVPVRSRKEMIVTAHPEATRAGLAMLEAGGSAIDAMVAAQLVLGLVEPQSSGLGGGAFLVFHDATTGQPITLDGREMAPADVSGKLFVKPDGEPMGFFDAVIGGRSVGTPGTVALLEEAHQRWGKLPWEALFNPAVKLAENGFVVSPRLNASISAAAESLFRYPETQAYFFSEEGMPIFPGTGIRNQPYAETLRAISKKGASAFYTGDIAQDIVRTVQRAEGNPGRLTLTDLKSYEVKERPAVCFDYRSYEVCGMGPPSSGALTIGQILGILESFDLAKLGPNSSESWRLIGEASRLAFADRGRYMADTDYIDMPDGLLDKAYLAERAKLIPPMGQGVLSANSVQPGNPPSDRTFNLADDRSLELPSTSHLSIVDAAGNVVSMTTTIENGFGSRLMVRGFLLNNELTDFSFVPEFAGKPVANRVEPGKRPRSSMSPTIVYRNGKPWLALGSPGGSRIIGFVAKTLIAIMDWGMDPQAAVDLPHLVNRFGTYDLEAGTGAETFADDLIAIGFEVRARDLNSGLHVIELTEDAIYGGADPRREGMAAGN